MPRPGTPGPPRENGELDWTDNLFKDLTGFRENLINNLFAHIYILERKGAAKTCQVYLYLRFRKKVGISRSSLFTEGRDALADFASPDGTSA
jgi:hypothetical protein